MDLRYLSSRQARTLMRLVWIYTALLLPALALVWGAKAWLVNEAREQQLSSTILSSFNQIDNTDRFALWKLEAALDTADLLVNQLTAVGFDGLLTTPSRQRIEGLWEDLLIARKRYTQFRLLDLQGQELLRVDYSAQQAHAVADARLQFKGQRDYMQRAFELKDKQVLITAPEANMEWGKVAYPVQGVSRIIRPVLNQHGQRCGYLVINISVDKLMQHVHQLPTLVAVEPALLGAQGYYISSGEAEWAFGQQIPERAAFNIGQQFPGVWAAMQQHPFGTIQQADSLFVYKLARVSLPDKNIKMWPYQDFYYLSQIPTALIEQTITSQKNRALGTSLFATLALTVLLLPCSYLIAMHTRRSREGRLARAAMNSLSASLITDVEGNIVDVNQRFTAITGFSAAEAIGNNPRFLSSGKHDATFFSKLWRSLQEHGSWSGEIWNCRKNGEIYPQLAEIQAIKNARGAVTNYAASFVDISEQKEVEKQLKAASTHDPLTGCLNRRGFVQHLDAQVELNQRYASPYSLALLDIDYFKKINDEYGHDGGDKVLVDFVREINSQLRQTDILARFGGEEFVILMPMTPVQGAVLLLERIQSHIGCGNSAIPYRFSAGMTGGRQQDTSDAALKRADMALYCAKENGRDQIRIYADDGQHKGTRMFTSVPGSAQPVAKSCRRSPE